MADATDIPGLTDEEAKDLAAVNAAIKRLGVHWLSGEKSFEEIEAIFDLMKESRVRPGDIGFDPNASPANTNAKDLESVLQLRGVSADYWWTEARNRVRERIRQHKEGLALQVSAPKYAFRRKNPGATAWMIIFNGQTFEVAHSLGMEYIWLLLKQFSEYPNALPLTVWALKNSTLPAVSHHGARRDKSGPQPEREDLDVADDGADGGQRRSYRSQFDANVGYSRRPPSSGPIIDGEGVRKSIERMKCIDNDAVKLVEDIRLSKETIRGMEERLRRNVADGDIRADIENKLTQIKKEKKGDEDTLAKLKTEHDEIQAHLTKSRGIRPKGTKGMGIPGKPRQLGDQQESDRVAVTRAIELAIKNIGLSSPKCAKYFSSHIKTGNELTYSDDRHLTWEL